MNHTQTETNALQTVTGMSVAAPQQNTSSTALMMDSASMDKMVRLAEIMASGKSTLPVHLRGNTGDCLAVVMQAVSWNMNPYAVAQKTHLVNGTLGYEAQLVAAVINNSGMVRDRFNFEWFGNWEKIVGKFKEVESKTKKDDNGHPKKYIVPAWDQKDEHGLGIKVWATLKGEAEPRELTLLMTQARTRNSTLWTEDPKQQLAYLAQKRWARLHAPDVILGVYTPDEFDAPPPRDMGAAEVIRPTASSNLIDKARIAADGGRDNFSVWWKTCTPDERVSLRSHMADLEARTKRADQGRTVDAAPPATPAAAPPAPAGKTFDEVMAMLCAAKTEDALFVAGEWIEAIAEDDGRAILQDKFDECLSQVQGAAA